MIVVGFSALANNGKTTLITKLCNILISNFNVAVIKHDPKNKAVIDYDGKDSAKFYNTGADIALISPSQTTIRYHEELSINQAIDILNKDKKCDYIFIEGFKDINMLRIYTIVDKMDLNLMSKADAIAVKKNSLNLLSAYNNVINSDIIDLDNTKEILDWINENGSNKNWNNNSIR